MVVPYCRESPALAFDPRLPLDLERLVLEEAAMENPVAIPKLMLIAKRVKYWLEPLLYRLVLISHFEKLAGIPNAPPDILMSVAERTRHTRPGLLSFAVESLFLATSPSKSRYGICGPNAKASMTDILSACTGVSKLLATEKMAPYIPFLAAMPLRYLTIDTRGLFEPAPRDFSHSLFRNVTHLELLDVQDPKDTHADEWAGLTELPSLTHLAFNFFSLCAPIHDATLAPACTSLRAIVLLRPQNEYQAPRDIAQWSAGLAADPRFAYIGQADFQQDWVRSARGERTYWCLADVVVKRRMADPSASYYRTAVDEFGWTPTSI
uniref:F-box domain-containing protein n=1 Tax=Mycena chlorophos TaxID=658473 RepID=A0ABQ0L0B2_MYCCL|nr:predicted protein [Mycena chlorophos]